MAEEHQAPSAAGHDGEKHKASAAPAGNNRKRMIVWVMVALVVVGAVGGGLYWYVSNKTVYIDDSEIEAPLINLSPSDSGVLQAVYVQEGDMVMANQPIAEVGDEIVKATTAGEIVTVDDNIGQYMNTLTGQGTVATMIDPTQLRVVGNLDENKGLSDVQVGDPVTFTVDAFGGEQFKGVVDEVSPTAEQTDVVFNISDQRPTNEFAIKVRFDPSEYPQLKNGMSARMWIYKQ